LGKLSIVGALIQNIESISIRSVVSKVDATDKELVLSSQFALVALKDEACSAKST
jgi:hypothetical protein